VADYFLVGTFSNKGEEKMEKKIDIYNYDYRMGLEIKSIATSNLSRKNKKCIINFKDSYILEGLSKARITKLFVTMTSFLKCI
jgi:hypothetical protein